MEGGGGGGGGGDSRLDHAGRPYVIETCRFLTFLPYSSIRCLYTTDSSAWIHAVGIEIAL